MNEEFDSPWFEGPWGFVMADPEIFPFFPCNGRLGIFEVEGYPHGI